MLINKFNLKSEMKFDDHKKKYFSKKKARPQKRVISGLAGGEGGRDEISPSEAISLLCSMSRGKNPETVEKH